MKRFVLALALLSASLSAPSCQPDASTAFEPATISVASGSVFSANVVVNTTRRIRAWELDVVSSDPAVAVVLNVLPHPDFDDDGEMFLPASIALGLGEARDAVDVRHGGTGVTGPFAAATVYIWAVSPGAATIRIDGGGLSTDAGTAIGSTAQHLSLSVTP
jgi:hypothetical protein